MHPYSQLYVMFVLFLSTVVPSVAAFTGTAYLKSKTHNIRNKESPQVFNSNNDDNVGVFSRRLRHSLSPLDERVAVIRESGLPLLGMTISDVDADTGRLCLRCTNITHEATFTFAWWKLDEIAFIKLELDELAKVDEEARAARLRKEQERKRFYASYMDKTDGLVDYFEMQIANYQREVMPAVGATIHDIYLGGGHIVSLDGSPPGSSVNGWTELLFDLGDDGWLGCFNALDENGYNYYTERRKNDELVLCSGTSPLSMTSVAEKIERLRDAIRPLYGKKIEYFETMETFNRENNTWEEDTAMPIRIFCSNQTVFSFGWWKADSIQVAECESPEVGRVSLGDLTLAGAADMSGGGDSNPSKRWKRNEIESIMPAIGETIRGARLLGADNTILGFDLGDNNWLEVYNDLGKNGYIFYNVEKRTSDDDVE